MRRLFILVVILLAAASIAAQEIEVMKCQDMNPFLAALQGFGVRVFDIPVEEDRHCAPEWQIHGSCCNSTTAARFIHRRARSNFDVIQRILRQLAVVNDHVESYLVRRGVRTNLSTATSTDKAYLALSRLLARLSKRIHFDSKNCLNVLKDISQRAVCDVCSGRSDRYFKDGKYIIHEPVCRHVLGSCGNSWKTLIQIAQAVRSFTNLVNDLSGARTSAVSLTKSIQGYTRLNNLDLHFSKCKNFKTCPLEDVKPICERFITVINPSYLESFTRRRTLQKIVQRLMMATRALNKDIIRINKQIKMLMNNNYSSTSENVVLLNKKLSILKEKAREANRAFRIHLKRLNRASRILRSHRSHALHRRLQLASPATGYSRGDIMVAPCLQVPGAPRYPNTQLYGFFGPMP